MCITGHYVQNLHYIILNTLNIIQDIVALQESRPADDQLKIVQKKCLESENNVVIHTIFVVWLTCQPGPY